MTNTNTKDVDSTINQINDLEKVGCDIVRVAVTDLHETENIRKIKDKVNLPLVADIQFDYEIAIECVKNGIDKIRINPGNIGGRDKIKEVVEVCKYHNVPIRIGINGGSLEKDLLQMYT